MKFLFSIISSLQTICSFSGPISAAENPKAHEVLDYWFGSIKAPEDYPQDKAKIWFASDENIDREIRVKFEPLVIAASNEELDSWKNTPKERLALIILLDQFSRNIYRKDARAFSFDSLAQSLALEGLERGDDVQLLPIERIFFYLPFEHAENLSIQELSVKKFKELLEHAPISLKAEYESYLDYAVRHYELIERFGRFPYRNQVLKETLHQKN